MRLADYEKMREEIKCLQATAEAAKSECAHLPKQFMSQLCQSIKVSKAYDNTLKVEINLEDGIVKDCIEEQVAKIAKETKEQYVKNPSQDIDTIWDLYHVKNDEELKILEEEVFNGQGK